MGSVVKLNENRIEVRVCKSVAQVRIGHNALWGGSDHHGSESPEMVHHRSIVSTQWHRDSTRTSLNIKIESIHTSITERTRPTPGGRRWPESSVQKVSKCDSRVVAGYENACRSATEREQDPLPLRLAVCDVFPDLRARSEELSGLVLRVDVVPSTSIAEVCSWVAICSILVREHIYKCDRDDIDGRVGAKASEGFLAGALTPVNRKALTARN